VHSFLPGGVFLLRTLDTCHILANLARLGVMIALCVGIGPTGLVWRNAEADAQSILVHTVSTGG
jgi:hypothetical protein